MIKKLLVLLAMSGALAVAHADTITFQPNSQTISTGSSTTVSVYLSASEVIGGFDLFVLNDPAILKATNVSFFTNLGSDLSFTATSLTTSSAEGYEISLADAATLASLQTTQPFALIQITYLGVSAGTSSLTMDSSSIFTDPNGVILPDPSYTAGSITVTGGTIPPPTVPEPSTFIMLGTGSSMMLAVFRRRLQSAFTR